MSKSTYIFRKPFVESERELNHGRTSSEEPSTDDIKSKIQAISSHVYDDFSPYSSGVRLSRYQLFDGSTLSTISITKELHVPRPTGTDYMRQVLVEVQPEGSQIPGELEELLRTEEFGLVKKTDSPVPHQRA